MYKIVLVFLFLFSGVSHFSFGQLSVKRQKLLDKLQHQTAEDSNRVNTLNKLCGVTSKIDFIESYNYGKEALELAGKIHFLKGEVDAYNNLGDAYWYHADYTKAQDYYFKAYKINETLGDDFQIARSLYNIGWIICLQQYNFKEIGYLYKSLSIYEKLGDIEGIIQLHNAIGNVYSIMNQRSKNNMYFDSAYAYFFKGIEIINVKNLPKFNLGIFYGNIGELYSQVGNYEIALSYSKKYQEISKQTGDSLAYFLASIHIANYELSSGNIKVANSLYENIEPRISKQGLKDLSMELYKGMYQCNEKLGNINKAYEYFKKFTAYDDSLYNEVNSASLNDIKATYEIEKRESNIRDLTAANQIQELQAKQNKLILFVVGIILCVIIIIAYLLYKRNKEKHLVNLQLNEQNIIISQKKKEIENSIEYAKGIQTAFLPEVENLKKVFAQSFVFYRPKDVVSGDFYWFYKVEDDLFCVVADCTGHGVPGALMSIVSVDKIEQAVFEQNLKQPKEILAFINVQIKKALKQQDDSAKQKDGLDIAFLKIDLKTNQLSFSGANRPLIITNKDELTEYKPDKVAIAGFTSNEYVFSQTEIQLKENDCIYIFSDGYADQFGGSEGKKFMTKNFKTLLKSVSSDKIEAQEREIVAALDKWKGNYEQVDDILVIGIKI